MNRVFDGYSPVRTRIAPSYPALNIWSSEEGLVVNAEVPGIDVEDIDISVVGETLTLSGARKSEDLEEGARYHRQERGYGKFNRSVELPFPVDIDKVEATFKNGVLHISLPRSEADKPKKIVVKSA
jgi:HSP20 family protein